MGAITSERERAISYVKDGLIGHFEAQDFASGIKAERFLCALEDMSDDEYLESFVFCSCCEEEREVHCHHLI